jgi:hypothetical protein
MLSGHWFAADADPFGAGQALSGPPIAAGPGIPLAA